MKLFKDFGVRALLAVIAAAGYYAVLIITFVMFKLSFEEVVTILSAASSPWLLAMGFYFGAKSTETTTPTNGDTVQAAPPAPITPAPAEKPVGQT